MRLEYFGAKKSLFLFNECGKTSVEAVMILNRDVVVTLGYRNFDKHKDEPCDGDIVKVNEKNI